MNRVANWLQIQNILHILGDIINVYAQTMKNQEYLINKTIVYLISYE